MFLPYDIYLRCLGTVLGLAAHLASQFLPSLHRNVLSLVI